MINLETEALYSIVLQPNEFFYDECRVFFKKNNLDFNFINNQINFNFLIKAPFYLSHLYSEKDIIDFIKKNNTLELKDIFHNRYDFISNSIIDDQFVLLFEEDHKLNFFKNNIIRNTDIFRKTLNPIEVKKDISRFNNLTEKELYYYQIWGYPYYFDCTSHHIPIIKNININSFETNFTHVQYQSLKLLKQKNIKNDEYIELISIS